MRAILKTLGILAVLAWLTAFSPPADGCTMALLTDGGDALFINNEDFSNPATRIWFVPAAPGRYATVRLGFDDGWAQGGMNENGLAFDWWAGGFDEGFGFLWGRKPVFANPAERMLETCSTVHEATAFFRRHMEPSFAYAWLFVADRTGASAILRVREGELELVESNQSNGIGACGETLRELLEQRPEPTLENGRAILERCRQDGEFATRYSNIFDLSTGDIYVLGPDRERELFHLDLSTEVARGPHYYDIPLLATQYGRPPEKLPFGVVRLLPLFPCALALGVLLPVAWIGWSIRRRRRAINR